MTTKPGTMKQNPPVRAPAQPRSRHAQRMASCVDAGPGSRLQAAMPSSNSVADIHSRSSTHSLRRRAMWVGGPPNPMHPIRPHSRAMVVRRTGSPVACIVRKGYANLGPQAPPDARPCTFTVASSAGAATTGAARPPPIHQLNTPAGWPLPSTFPVCRARGHARLSELDK